MARSGDLSAPCILILKTKLLPRIILLLLLGALCCVLWSSVNGLSFLFLYYSAIFVRSFFSFLLPFSFCLLIIKLYAPATSLILGLVVSRPARRPLPRVWSLPEATRLKKNKCMCTIEQRTHENVTINLKKKTRNIRNKKIGSRHWTSTANRVPWLAS